VKLKSSTRAFEESAARASVSPGRVVLRLYVAGSSPRSLRAIQNAREICEEHFKDRHDLEVIDIFQQPELVRDDQVFAVPTLIRRQPEPSRRFIGDLSDRNVVLTGLDIKAKVP
jgi:circadian clock protein KaiB